MMPLLVATLEGDVIPLGRSFASRMKSRVKGAAKSVGKAAAVTTRATGGVAGKTARAVKKGAVVTGRTVGRGAAVTTRTTGGIAAKTARAVKKGAVVTGRTVGHGAATVGRAVGHGAATVGRIALRQAKRIIRSVARPMVAKLLEGDEATLFGADDPSTAAQFLRSKRDSIIGSVTTAATNAVAASGVAAPAAPAVPVLLPPILDELIDQVAKKGRNALKGQDATPDPATPDPVGVEAGPDLTNSGAISGVMSSKILGVPAPVLLAGAGLAAFLLLRKKGA